MTDIQPIDSAFTGGRLEMTPLSGDFIPFLHAGRQAEAVTLTGTVPMTVLIIICTLVCLADIRSFINLTPSFAGCIVRWKENINLENSVMLRIARDRIFYTLAVPFCILAASYGIYRPTLLQTLPPVLYFLCVTAAFTVYLGIRALFSRLFRGRKMNIRIYTAATHSFRTFFIIMTAVMLATSGILKATGAGEDLSRDILLYEAALSYGLFLLRKTQIFINSCSVFTSIYYLCALEFLPTGILVATALVL